MYKLGLSVPLILLFLFLCLIKLILCNKRFITVAVTPHCFNVVSFHYFIEYYKIADILLSYTVSRNRPKYT